MRASEIEEFENLDMELAIRRIQIQMIADTDYVDVCLSLNSNHKSFGATGDFGANKVVNEFLPLGKKMEGITKIRALLSGAIEERIVEIQLRQKELDQ